MEYVAVCLGGRTSDLESFVYKRLGWSDLVVQAGELQRIDFSVPIPERVCLEWQQAVWVEARAVCDIEVTTGLGVEVLPLACFLELAGALVATARVPVTSWATIGGGDGVAARLVPEGPARKIFDGLRLEMFRSGPVLYGHLEIDPREHTLRDHLKAATRADRRRFPFRFRASQSDEVRNFFEQCLRPYLDAAGQLPIPSAVAPLDPATLPYPSQRGDGRQE